MKQMTSTFKPLLSKFRKDEAGAYLIVAAVSMPVLIGAGGLGAEAAVWLHEHRRLQGAADTAAITAATARYRDGASTDVRLHANSVLASYGLNAGANATDLTVNNPPASGQYAGRTGAVEIVVSQTRPRLFTALWNPNPIVLSARAVAVGKGGAACVLALNPTASGSATVQGSANVVLDHCGLRDNSNNPSAVSVGGSGSLVAESVSAVGGVSGTSSISTTNGIRTGEQPTADPYAEVAFPPFFGCAERNLTVHDARTLNPGVYCGGMRLNAGANVTLNPGIYFIDRGDLTVNGGSTLTGTGVTLVFTSSSGSQYPSATINGGALIALTAPASGPTAGIAIFGDRMMPQGTRFRFEGGASQSFQGAVYVPKGEITFSGGSDTTLGCTQLIGDTITFTGNSNFSLNCSALGTRPIGSALATLVE